MTGFARAEGSHGPYAWTWEARSVNARALDVRIRVAGGFDRLEPAARAAAAERFKRGNINVALVLQAADRPLRMRINRELLDDVLRVAAELEGAGAAKPRLDALLAVRGIIEPVEEEDEAEREAAEAAMLTVLGQALDGLAAARAEEGGRLLPVLTGHLDRIEELVAAARASAGAQPQALAERLRTQVAELLQASAGLPEERLAQEAALIAAKADIREELDRLSAHVAQAREMLAAAGAVGRRLDFLCQEFNREANTLCSKAADVDLTRIGLDLKATVEQLREQIQNIE
ncbi:MAG: YicC family protein [Inquilinus sp.]|nr:YicC family protein [Inquilinus sp.]